MNDRQLPSESRKEFSFKRKEVSGGEEGWRGITALRETSINYISVQSEEKVQLINQAFLFPSPFFCCFLGREENQPLTRGIGNACNKKKLDQICFQTD